MPQQDKEKCDMLNIQRQALARNIARQTEQNHRLETAVPGLVLVRYEAPTQPASCMYEPTICLVAQGAKRVMLGDEEYLYDANHYLISSVGLPVVANVVEASPEVPLLGMVLKLDMRMLAQMMVDSNLPVSRAAKSGRGMRVSEVCMPLLNAFHRSHHAQGWQVLGVAIDKAAAVQQFLRKLPLDYPVALAGPGGVGLTRALGNLPGGLPFTLVTAANGRILHRKIGQIQAPDLEHWAASMV